MNESPRTTPRHDIEGPGRVQQSETVPYVAPTLTELGDFTELTKGTGSISVEPLAFGFNG